jgi:hypothetical protein
MNVTFWIGIITFVGIILFLGLNDKIVIEK